MGETKWTKKIDNNHLLLENQFETKTCQQHKRKQMKKSRITVSQLETGLEADKVINFN